MTPADPLTGFSLPDDLLAGCRRAGELARASAAETDRDGVLPPAVIAALDEARLFSLALPRGLGGLGRAPGEVVRAVEELTHADAALGWTALIGQSSGFLAWMDPDAAAEITAGTPHPRVAGSMAPAGRGVPAPGPGGTPGFLLSGRWPYNSGVRHAQWLAVAFMPAPPDGAPPPDGPPAGGPPPALWAVVPAAAARTLPTWDVLGLRGTASDDLVLEDVWVPRARTFDPLRRPARHDGALYRHSLFAFLMTMMAGFPLGLTRRVLDDFTAIAAAKGRLGSGKPLLDDPLVSSWLLRAHEDARAARLLVREAVSALPAAGPEESLRTRAELAASVQHAQRVCLDTAERAFQLTGAGALYAGHPLQRAWRDALTASSHIAFSGPSAGRTARALFRPEALAGMDALLV